MTQESPHHSPGFFKEMRVYAVMNHFHFLGITIHMFHEIGSGFFTDTNDAITFSGDLSIAVDFFRVNSVAYCPPF